MGTNNWADPKRDLLARIGVEDVFICMDGDDAGRKKARELIDGCDSHGPVKGTSNIYFNNVYNINLPDGVDPGILDEDQIVWLKSYMENPCE
jgi:DNA primase